MLSFRLLVASRDVLELLFQSGLGLGSIFDTLHLGRPWLGVEPEMLSPVIRPVELLVAEAAGIPYWDFRMGTVCLLACACWLHRMDVG